MFSLHLKLKGFIYKILCRIYGHVWTNYCTVFVHADGFPDKEQWGQLDVCALCGVSRSLGTMKLTFGGSDLNGS